MTTQDIINIKPRDFLGLTKEQFHDHFDTVKEAQRLRQKQAILTFDKGDRVEFKGRRGLKLVGEVLKVNITTLTVRVDDQRGSWSVHPTQCTKVV